MQVTSEVLLPWAALLRVEIPRRTREVEHRQVVPQQPGAARAVEPRGHRRRAGARALVERQPEAITRRLEAEPRVARA